MTESETSELHAAIAQRHWRRVSAIVEKQQRRRLDGALFPLFAPLLKVKDHVIYKYAITIVGKMRNPPAEAFDAVLNAWRDTWIGSCPQCSGEALSALISIDALNPQIISEIERCLSVDNFQVQKECAQALMKINSPEARRVLQNFESYLPRSYTEKLMHDLLAKVRAHVQD